MSQIQKFILDTEDGTFWTLLLKEQTTAQGLF